MFKTTSNKGFKLTFANGWTASVQWGPGNYCDKRMNAYGYDAPKKTEEWESETAEVAAWDASGKWFDFGGDTIQGYLSADDVATFINMIAMKG